MACPIKTATCDTVLHVTGVGSEEQGEVDGCLGVKSSGPRLDLSISLQAELES